MAKEFLKRPCILDEVSAEYLMKYRGKAINSTEARCELRLRATYMQLSIARLESRWSEIRRLSKLLGTQTLAPALEHVSAKTINRWLKKKTASRGHRSYETLGNILQQELDGANPTEDPNRLQQQRNRSRRVYSAWNAYVSMKIQMARDAGDDAFQRPGPDKVKLWSAKVKTWSAEWRAATDDVKKFCQKRAQIATRRRELGMPPWRLRLA
eukprot:3973683-Pyramimonas_sp.AAC.1